MLNKIIKVLIIIIGVILIGSFLVGIVILGIDELDKNKCNVAVIELQGNLSTFKESAEDFTVLSSDIVSQIEAADNNEDIKAIVLNIDSTGGYALAGEEVAKALISAQKPTVALIRIFGDSAAYLAASGADKIFASKYSDVGSIAVTQSYTDNVIYNEKEGYTFNQLTSGKYKNIGTPDKPLTPDEKNILMRDINIMHENFVKDVATNRNLDIAKVITSDFGPYGLHRARDEKFFKDSERIFSARKTHKPNFTYVNHPCYVSQTFFVIKPQGDINIKYLTAILNSQLSNFWFKNKGKRQGELLQIDKEPLLNFPIYQPDLSDKDDKMLHDKIVTLVDEMLKLNKTPESREKNKTKIDAVDYEIDKLVYKLYGLTDEEIKLIEV